MNDLRIGTLPPIQSEAIDINQVDIANTGIFTYQGQPVIMYVKDVRKKMKVLAQHTQQLPKFHLTDCITVANDRRKPERYQRYAISTQTDNLFPLYTLTNEGEIAEAVMKLSVCRSCLSKLGYQSYDSHDKATQDQIVAEFSITAFFAQHSTPETATAPVRVITDEPCPPCPVTPVEKMETSPPASQLPITVEMQTNEVSTAISQTICFNEEKVTPDPVKPTFTNRSPRTDYINPLETFLTHFYVMQLLLKQVKQQVLGHVF